MKKVLLFLLLFTTCFSADKYEVIEKSSYVKTEPKKWQIRWHLARVLSYAKRNSEAVDEYQKLLKEKSGLYGAKIEFVNLFLSENDLENAVNIAKTIPLRKLDFPTKLVLADIYFQIKQYDDAERLYRKYLIHNPTDFSARSKLAAMYVLTARYQNAIKEYKAILYRDPQNVEARKNYLLVSLLAKNENSK